MKIFLLSLLASLPAFAQHSVTLTWPWSQGVGDPATGFHCQRASVTGGPYTIVQTSSALTLTCTDNTVVAGQTYFYIVTAFNSGGDGPPSNEVKTVIPISVPNAVSGLNATVK